jgi:hypothetical protein
MTSPDIKENFKLVEAQLNDLENIKMMKARQTERLNLMMLGHKLIELALNFTPKTKIKFMLFLINIKITPAEVIQLLPKLYTDDNTIIIIKKMVSEMYELKN